MASIGQDADDDGIVNAIEFLKGTLPEDGVSAPEFRSGQKADNSAFFEVDLEPDAVLVKWSEDMSDWKTSALTQSMVDQILKVTHSSSTTITRLFWRMEVHWRVNRRYSPRASLCGASTVLLSEMS